MKILRTAAAAGAGLLAYACFERRWYRVAEKRVPVRCSARGITVLHVSDTHLSSRNRPLIRFLERLPGVLPQEPDIVVATGDLITGDGGIDPIVALLGALPAALGRFYVLGSHDYYQPKFEGYVKYFSGRRDEIRPPRADTQRLEAGLAAAGWVSLANRTELLDGPGGRIRMAGVDDPYLRRHRTGHIRRSEKDDLAIGLVHSPDVVSPWLLEGFDLVLAGHTHGGQVRMPGIGALVTNSSLPARLAGGLNPVGQGWLHVSTGLGNGPFSPIRFNCRPEATLLRLTPRS